MQDKHTTHKLAKDHPDHQDFRIVLGKENYYLIILGVIVLIVGYMLMSGGKHTDPQVFNPEELYSTRRIVIAPIVIVIGFIIEIYALFHKSK